MIERIIKPVYAHCDIPCGIYETDTMRHAAETCLRMVEKIDALGELDTKEKMNNFNRMVAIKELHAQRAKNEIYLLWSDYFKPEHLMNQPDLHTIFWQAAKQTSIVKQTISKSECDKLLEYVGTIEDIFNQSKSAHA